MIDEEHVTLSCRKKVLKHEITNIENAHLVPKYTTTTKKLRVLDELEAIKRHKLSCIKWFGEGDKPYSFFFKLAKAKHQRETLS